MSIQPNSLEEAKQYIVQLETRIEEYQRILNTLPMSIYWKDQDLVYLGHNKAFGQIFDVEFVGHSDTELGVDEEQAKDERHLMAEDKPRLKYEEHIILPDGTEMWYQSSKMPLHDNSGAVVGIVGYLEDITEDKKKTIIQESKLADQTSKRELLNQVIDLMPGMIFVKDWDGHYQLANQVLAQTFGTTPDNIIGKTLSDFSSDKENIQKILEADQAVIASGETVFIPEETVQNPQTGETLWLRTTKIPLEPLSEDDKPRLLVITLDITPEKEAAQERIRLQQEIIETQRSTLVELSTPIIPIMERVLVIPLIGAIDSTRSREIMRSLLAGITQYRAKTVILDITGVAIVDTGVADHLNKTIQAARLKGATTIVTGVSDAVAETIVDLGIDWSEVSTVRDLQSGLTTALEDVGLTLERIG